MVRLPAVFMVVAQLGVLSPAAPRPNAAPVPQAQMLLRTGDQAPVEARVPESFSGTLGYLPDGRITFIAGTGYALEILEAGRARTLLHVGDSIAGCGTVSAVYYHSAGADGTIAALVACFARQAIVRVDPADGSATVALRTDQSYPPDPSTYGNVRGTAVDGAGRIVAAVDTHEGTAAIVRQTNGGATETLIQTGDPLGAGTFVEALRQPAVNTGGMVAFGATTSLGTEVIATLTPGEAPAVLFSVPIVGPPGYAPQPLGLAPPALNDDGVVAFLWGDPDTIRVQRAAAGVVDTVAEAGDPAPGGGTFTEIDWVYPAVDDSGGVIFGASRSNGIAGLYRFDVEAARVAERLDSTGNGEYLVQVGEGSSTPLPCADGAVRFDAVDTVGPAIFASRDGVVTPELRAGVAMTEPARFVQLEQTGSVGTPHLSAGPYLAPGGAIIFDAVASGRGRGLYARAADGTLAAVAIDGDPAPGGGHFDGTYFGFHSIASGGRVAFLGAAPDGPRSDALQLFTGPSGGPLERVVGVGDTPPGSDAPIILLLPPSPINAAGSIVVPAILDDGGMVLLAWSGGALTPIAASGDLLPGGEVIASLLTGQMDALLPPLLDDAGGLLFGVTTAGGQQALYRTTLAGGAGSAVRVLGDGDLVQNGVLQPFLLRALAVDRSGRIAFQAVPAPGPEPATYSADVGPIPRRVVNPPVPGMPPPPPGVELEPDRAWPRLAALTGGAVVHESTGGFRGKRLLFAMPRVPTDPDPATAYDQTVLVGGGDVASPDGGVFLRGSLGLANPGSAPPDAMRLGSDGDRYVVAVEPTSVNPEILVLFDLRPNQAPIAAAGPDRIVECAGPLGASVMLDATASTDPESGALEYVWSGPFGTASGPTPTVTLPLGTWTVDLTARDPAGAVALDTVVVTVRDTVAPAITVRATPASLWPPDGRLVPVFFDVDARDLCDPEPRVVLGSIVTDDPDGDPANDVVDAALGTDDRAVLLRARRPGRKTALTYTAIYFATDASGNPAAGSTAIPVHRKFKPGRLPVP